MSAMVGYKVKFWKIYDETCVNNGAQDLNTDLLSRFGDLLSRF